MLNNEERQWHISIGLILCTTIVFISYFITYFTSVFKMFNKILSVLFNLKTTANHNANLFTYAKYKLWFREISIFILYDKLLF